MSRSRITSSLIALSCIALLSACGGGGGGGVTEPTTTTPPANTVPVANSLAVSTEENSPVEIVLTGSDDDGDSLEFSITSDPASGTLSGTPPNLTYTPGQDFAGDDSFTFTVTDGTDTSVTATVNITVTPLYVISGTTTGLVNNGLTLENNGADTLEVASTSFEFPTQLADGSTYDVTIAALPENQLCELSNASGTVAGADVTDVSVFCRSWRTAMAIESGDGTAHSPQLAVDANGNALAVWVQDDGTYDRVWFNRYVAGSGWGTAEIISSSTGDAETPQILVDSDGDALVAWAQQGPEYMNLWTSLYQSSTGDWTTPGFIEYNPGNVANLQVALHDSTGRGLIVWEQDDDPATTTPNPTNIWAIEWDSGWGTAELIETDGGSAQVPQVAFDSAGNAIAVWSQYNGSTAFDIRANTWSSTSGWGTPQDIETTDDGNSFNPQIVFDSNDKATVVWSSDDGTRHNIWATTFTEADGWGEDVLLETDNAGTAFDPQVAADNNGNLIAAWRQNDGTRYNTVANIYTAGSGWGTAETIESDDGTSAGVQVAFDPAGNAIAVWRSFDAWANTWSPIGGWSTAQKIETDGAGSANSPQIGFDADGNATVVWMEGDGTRDNIRTNRFE